ncbi:MAG: ATP-binding protein [Myxococcota bacterium]|nr:ATP-binding protein [Myxococcota bacterium]
MGYLLSTQVNAADNSPVEPVVQNGLREVYKMHAWSQREGLPQSTVTGIIPEIDGTLLISTFAGLARLDGQQIAEVKVTGEFSRAFQITLMRPVEDAPGETWLGTVDHGLWLYSTTFSQPDQPTELLKATIWDIDERDDNLLVSSTVGGFLRNKEGEWSRITDKIHLGRQAEDGTRWFCGLGDGVSVQYPGKDIEHITMPEDEVCLSGLLDPDGEFWFLGRNKLFLVKADHSVIAVPGLSLITGWGQSPLLDHNKHLWVGTSDSIVEVGHWQEIKRAVKAGQVPELRTHPVGAPRAWYSSPTGPLWIGTVGEGLVRLAPMGFSELKGHPRRGSRGSGPLHGDQNSVWYTVDCRDLQVWNADGSGGPVSLPYQGFQNSLCIDALWAGDGRAFAARGQELLAGTEAGLEVVATCPEELRDDQLISIEGREDGGAWIGTEEGSLLSYDGSSMSLSELQPPDSTGQILDMLERSDGSLILSHSEGLCIQREQEWQCWSEDDGLAPGAIRHLLEDKDGRIWYASYGGGLGWVDDGDHGRVPIGEEGIPDRFLSTIIDDDRGSFWLQGNSGVIRVSKDELSRVGDTPMVPIRTELVEVGESNGFLRHSAALFNNTQIWIAGIDAISVVNTAIFRRDGALQRPVLRKAIVGDHILELDEPSSIPADAFRRLEVHYTSPDLENLGAWFEHRLVRSDEDTPWMAARETRTAVYPRLIPGTYRFEVREVGADGQKGEIAQIFFEVTPKWWEPMWVLPAGISILFMGLASLFSLRIREVGLRAQVLQAEVERRIDVERLLQEREARFSEVFHQAVNGFLLHDIKGNCLTVNPAACALFGLDEAALLATPRNELGLPEAHTRPDSGPFLCTRANGEHFAARIDEAHYDVGQGPQILTSIVDLTALFASQDKERTLRRQLASAQRLEALGRLAGGIAHDMNNVLAVISSNVDLLDEIVSETLGSTHMEATLCVSDAQEGVVRGSAMIQQLLNFSRKQSVELTSVSPDDVILSLERMLYQLIPSDRTLHIERNPGGQVCMNRTQLEQVIINLVLNASDAVGPSGNVWLTLSTLPDEDCIQITVEDDGPGIEQDVLEHLFEPFYTTKEVGKGTGLGLSTVKSVVESVGGSLTVKTSALGSNFLVTLPIERASPQAAMTQTKTLQGDGSLIVLVDDDSGVLRSVKRLLVRGGWTVEDFKDPLLAKQRLTQNDQAPALLITDVLMPSLNGRQLAKLATKRHPSLKVLFISGYTGDVLGDGSADGHQILQKPFPQQNLLSVVHHLMAEQPSLDDAQHDETPPV